MRAGTAEGSGSRSRLLAHPLAFAAAFLLLSPPPVQAQTYWQSLDPTADWSTAANWSGGLPTSSGTADIVNGGTASVTTTGDACWCLSLGSTAGSGAIQMTGGSLNIIYETYVGWSGVGTFTQSGGTNNISDYLCLGYNSGASGTYSFSGGALAPAGRTSATPGQGRSRNPVGPTPPPISIWATTPAATGRTTSTAARSALIPPMLATRGPARSRNTAGQKHLRRSLFGLQLRLQRDV